MKLPSINVMGRLAHRKMFSGRHLAPLNTDEHEECQCMNCSTKFKGNYCPNCGQSSSTGRLTMMHAVDNLLGLYFNLEKGMLHTCVDLLYRPGYMMRDYIKGHRVEYVKPIQLLFIFATIYVIFHWLLFGSGDTASEDKALSQEKKIEKKELKEHMKSMSLELNVEDLPDDDVPNKAAASDVEPEADKDNMQYDIHEMFPEIYDVIKAMMESKAVRALLLVTLMVFPYKICFRKTPVGQTINYVECFYVMVYVECQQFMFNIALLPFERFFGGDDATIGFGLLILWDTKQFYDISWRRSLKLNILSFILGIIILIVLGVIIGATTYMIWNR